MKKKRKALLLSAGYGRGHHSAAQALAEELERRGWKTGMTDSCAETSPRLFRATQLFYRACVQHAPWVWGMVYAQIEHADWASLVHAPVLSTCMEKLRRRIKKQKPQLIICTYPLYAYMLDAFAREGWFHTPYAVVVTDALAISRPWLQTQAPLICLPDEHSLALMQARYALPPGRLIAPGFPVRAAFTRNAADKLPIPAADGEGLHVVYGAYAPLARVRADVEALLEAWPRMRLSVLPAERGADKLRPLLQNNPAVSICEEDPAALLRSAHFYVGKAGASTLFEAYSAETPVLVNYALPGQEEGNLELLKRDGAGCYAESPAALVHRLTQLLAHGALGWQRMCRAMRQADRAKGAKRIADALEGRFFPS